MEVDSSWLAVTKVYAVVMTLCALVFAFGTVFVSMKVSRLIDTLLRRVEPVLRAAETAAAAVGRTTQTVSERADRVTADAEEKIGRAAADLEAAADAVRRAATGPAGSVAAVLTGLTKGLRSAAADPKPETRDTKP